MRRFAPRSLIGQIALVMALVLLIAQGINFYLLRSERVRLSRAQLEGPVINRFVAGAQRLGEADRLRPIATRRGRIAVDASSILSAEASDRELSGRLRDGAFANGLAVRDARAAISDNLPPMPPRARDAGQRRPNEAEDRALRFRSLILSVQLADARWVNAQLLVARPDPRPLIRLAIGTALIYLALLAAMVWVAARLTRPLRDLTRAAQRFGGSGPAAPLALRGPDDIRRAVEAFNVMSSRVGTLMEEKDRMLGAIGHDLRTPLASLRIRAESMEPADERERMIATIEEMAAMLDDTLALARSGRSNEPVRTLDLAALVDALVEEYRDMERDVRFDGSGRAVAPVRPNLVRRAVRNLIDNALKYAGSAELSVRDAGDAIAIEVADRGPGIPEGQLDVVREPFVRLETSRSRETGGSGLGLTLARAAALLHGGDLEIVNREGGGLLARLLLPRS